MPSSTYFNLQDKKKELIRDAVYNLFSTTPYEKVTIRELAHYTQLPLGSWYRYFIDKSEIYLYHVYQLQKRLTGNMDGKEILSNQPRRGKYLYELSELEQTFVKTIYDAPEDILFKFYFEYMVLENKETLTRYFENRKAIGAMDNEIDLDYFTYLVTTANFNMIMYMKKNKITDAEGRKMVYEKLHYPLFQAHFIKNDVKDERKK